MTDDEICDTLEDISKIDWDANLDAVAVDLAKALRRLPAVPPQPLEDCA